MMMDLRNRIKNNRKQVEKNEFAEPNQKIADYMMAEYPAPDALKEKILAAMTEQRAREEQAEEKAEVHADIRQKVFKRVAAVAALLALFIGITPIRGMVVSAAEEFRYLTSWTDDVFEIGDKQTKNDCTIEVIEASVVNECLYVTANTKYRDVALWESGTGMTVRYSGCLYSGIFHRIAFSMDNMAAVAEIYNRAAVYADDFDYQTQIYIPGLREFITDANKQYKCKLTAEFIDKDGNTVARFKFKFKLGTVEGVTTSKELPLSYTTQVDDMTFRFEKIVVSRNGSSQLFVQVIPRDGYKITKDVDFSLSVIFNDGGGWLDAPEENGYDYRFFNEIYVQVPIYVIDSRYYGILPLNSGYGHGKRFEDYSFDFNANASDFQMMVRKLEYYDRDPDDPDNPDAWGRYHYLPNAMNDFFDSIGVLDFVLPDLDVSYHEIDEVNVGPTVETEYIGNATYDEDGIYFTNVFSADNTGTDNVWTFDDRKFTFYGFAIDPEMTYFYPYEFSESYGGLLYIQNQTDDAYYIDKIQLAAVKNGKTLYTAVLKDGQVSCRMPYENLLPVEVRFYDNDGKEVDYSTVRDLTYDKLVLTRVGIYTYDGTNSDSDNITGYHTCYNPKYVSRQQCEEDVKDRIEKVHSLIIK